MPDIIIYFGPLEFTVLVAGLLLVLSLLLVLRQRRTRLQARRRLLDSLPYPALLFHGKRLAIYNSAAESWQDNLDLQALAIEALRTHHTIVRTIPAVEGQAYQVRAVYLPARETLLLLEDMAAARRQQAFYRNFINNVSHELKTPLTVIQGHAAKMSSMPDDRVGWEASLSIIADEGKRLTQLVDNLLTLAQLESPDFTISHSPLNFGALLENAILQLYDLAEARRLETSLNLAPALPRIIGDRVRLRQVVLNLLDNAMKYTPPGGSIDVSLETEAGWLVCKVRDTGEGIPLDDLPYVFDKLYRVRRTGRRPVEGSGLGLAIAQQIIQAHGGEIRVDSKVGVGTTFTLSLPCDD